MKRTAKTHEEQPKTEKSKRRPFYKNFNSSFYKSERFWSIALAAILLITAIAVCVNLRLATVDLEIADRWAENSIQQQGVSQFAAQVRQQYPTLPDASVQSEALKRWQTYKEQNAAMVNQQEQMLATQLRSFFQFEAGTSEPYNQTYVLEMDPYHFWEKAVNYADHGSICPVGAQQLTENTCLDVKRLAPLGLSERMNLHIFVEAYAIKVMQTFNSNLHSLSIVFFIPVLLAALAIVPAFFIGRKLAGNLGGFVAAMIIAVHPILMNRTIAGFSDTDGYVSLFSLLAVWLLLESFDMKAWWSRMVLASLAGLSIGLFAFAWAGWWFTFFILVVALLAILVYNAAVHLKRRERTREYRDLLPFAAILLAFVVASGMFVTAFVSFHEFTLAVSAPFAVSTSLQAATVGGDLTGWPNILTTVAELNIPNLPTIIGNLGGNMVVVLAAFGLFALLIDPRKLDWLRATLAAAALIYYFVLITKGLSLAPITFMVLFALPLAAMILYLFIKDVPVPRLAAAIIMMAWLLAVLFTTTKGIRFLLMGVPPFALGFGIAIGWIFIAIVHQLTTSKHDFKRIVLANVAVGFVLLLIIFNPVAGYNPIKAGQSAADNQIPGMNDAWWEALRVIREQTPENTIITSWWDFGHWFRTIGDRPVTFDGGSQNPEPGHIVGKILLTNSEQEALGLLRMMDCGQNTAYHVVRESMDIVPSRNLIGELVLLDEQAAEQRLRSSVVPEEDHARVLNYTHCEPPPAVFITSGDMVGKAGVWGHFGSWDFRRSMSYHYSKTLPQPQAVAAIEGLNFTSAEANELYFTIQSFNSESEANSWISGWPSFVTTSWSGCTATNSSTTCSIMAGIAQTQQGLLVIENIQFNKTAPEDAAINYGIYNNNVRLGGAVGVPARIVVADVNETRMSSSTNQNPDLAVGVLIRQQGDTYGVLLADPLQIDSLFTQLYFLDGAFTPHFTKLVETQETGGSRIIVWNVTWPEQ